MNDEDDEGYPSSSEADLDPGSDLTESLDDADQEARIEQRVEPEGQGPDDSVEDDDAAATGIEGVDEA